GAPAIARQRSSMKARNRKFAGPARISSSPTTKRKQRRRTSANRGMRIFPARPRRTSGLYTLVALMLLYSSVVAAQELRRIHYGTSTSTAHLPVWVAKDSGLFVKNGLNVEPVQMRGGPLITMGIMSGQLQFSGAGAESVVAARIEGGDIVLLACPINSEPVYLITRPEIKSPTELKGKFTAVTRLGSTT